MLQRTAGVVRTRTSQVAHGLGSTPVGRDPGVRRFVRSRPNWFFVAVALILLAVAWPVEPTAHSTPPYMWPVLAGTAVLPVALAYAAPMIGWGISLAAALAINLFVPGVAGWPWGISVPHIIALVVLTFCAVLWVPLPSTAGIWLGTAVMLWLVAPADQRGGWIFGLTVMTIVVVGLRYLLRTRQQLAAQTEEAELAESRKAVLEERARIARDLHDVVAHRMSVVVVMAQTARYRLADVSDEAAAEFESIATAARASLDEVRQLLGVLRVDDGSTAVLAPNPGLDDIAGLITDTRRTGVDVFVDDTLDRDKVGGAAALTVYRIVQESLANATRHAPGAPISIRLSDGVDSTADGSTADVLVLNGAPTTPPIAVPGGGNGIAGMLERAAIHGGTVTTGARADGGFEVRARIPAR